MLCHPRDHISCLSAPYCWGHYGTVFRRFRWFKVGDCAGALIAAQTAAPYCHARLTSSDLRIRNEFASKSDADIASEMAESKRKFAAARVVN